jgi:hypothetical protein
VVGMSAGLSVVASAVNSELKEVGFAIRSLDQSYHIPGQVGCSGAATAASTFTQTPVKRALDELCEVAERAERAAKDRADSGEKGHERSDVKERRRPQPKVRSLQSERMKRQLEQQRAGDKKRGDDKKRRDDKKGGNDKKGDSKAPGVDNPRRI